LLRSTPLAMAEFARSTAYSLADSGHRRMELFLRLATRRAGGVRLGLATLAMIVALILRARAGAARTIDDAERGAQSDARPMRAPWLSSFSA
jgi:hypothetical protein